MRVVNVVSILGLMVMACSSSNSTTPDSGSDSTASKDGGSKDSTTGSDAAKDSSPGDTSTTDTTGDTSPTDSGGDTETDAGCSGMKAGACMTCCRKENAAGAKQLEAAELACACEEKEDGGAKTLCGPVDGGMPDGGDFGEGACSASCGSVSTTKPDMACTECLTKATGTKKNKGPCYTAVEEACVEAGSECIDYATCIMGCK
jgi:hypothetical protein